MKETNRDKGFSLVELIVVIAIMAVLVGVIAPQFLGYVNKTKRAVDDENIFELNRITGVYATENNITSGDIFEGFDTNEARIDELIDAGFLGSEPEPKTDNASFAWNIPSQTWFAVIQDENSKTVTYLFGGASSNDYVTTNTWTTSDNGLVSSGGRLFVENPNDEYTIKVKAKLAEGDGGGYGIFFDSKFDENESNFDNSKDTGYIMQFDRGVNGIKIEFRDGWTTYQGPYSSGSQYNHDYSSVIPESKNDSWWAEEHEITMDVNHIDEDTNMKSMTLKIDGELVVENYEFESKVSADENQTGFRSWGGNGGTTEYRELTITGK